ncbi:Uncharacterised protein [Streptococcus pneumoniae]|nr:Uncharacterised protein [Streptococcus pneumoniae]
MKKELKFIGLKELEKEYQEKTFLRQIGIGLFIRKVYMIC